MLRLYVKDRQKEMMEYMHSFLIYYSMSCKEEVFHLHVISNEFTDNDSSLA